jgi:hypothetical protein
MRTYGGVEIWLHFSSHRHYSRVSAVSIETGYGPDDREVGVRQFSLLHSVQTGSGSYPMGTEVSFSGGKAAEA